MSASPMARQAAATTHQGMPVRRVVINHESDMPTDYGTTPGGTMFGTTPGGTRIVYERAFLLSMRQSPLARSPPANLPDIPGVTTEKTSGGGKQNGSNSGNNKNEDKKKQNGNASNGKREHNSIKEEAEGEEQFSMDM